MLINITLLYLIHFPPHSASTLGILTVVVKDGCLIEVFIGVSGLFATICSTVRSPPDLRSAFRLPGLAESGGRERVLFETALSLWEWFYVDVPISWQAQCFGYGGLRCALASWQVQ